MPEPPWCGAYVLWVSPTQPDASAHASGTVLISRSRRHPGLRMASIRQFHWRHLNKYNRGFARCPRANCPAKRSGANEKGTNVFG
jgi:hypothetical protein